MCFLRSSGFGRCPEGLIAGKHGSKDPGCFVGSYNSCKSCGFFLEYADYPRTRHFRMGLVGCRVRNGRTMKPQGVYIFWGTSIILSTLSRETLL